MTCEPHAEAQQADLKPITTGLLWLASALGALGLRYDEPLSAVGRPKRLFPDERTHIPTPIEA